MKLAILLAALAPLVTAKCPSVPTADDKFQLDAYLGRWYEVAKNAGFARIFERDGYCITADYSLNSDGSIKVDNGLSKGGPDGDRKDAIATAKQVSGAKLGVSFFLPSFDFSYQDYWVIDLEGSAEESYQVAMVWSCQTTLGIDNQNMWILSRTPTLPPGVTLDSLYAKASAMGVDVPALKMEENDFTGCVFSGVPVEASDSVFEGDYSDPNHPGCPRNINVSSDGMTGYVTGADGDEGSPDCANAVAWGPLDASINGDSIKIDFSPKGGPSDLTAEYDYKDGGVLFSDGNLWSKI
mmetsp:Transcript_18016/g.36099  ORF Transcript_18016/g.36099 Transcript_18016/m.36099 type:complete len:296 (-) Transcript_18016:43-930(-)